MKMELKIFKDKKQTIRFLKENKDAIMKAKYASLKNADAFSCHSLYWNEKEEVVQKQTSISNWNDLKEIKVQAIINTTNIIDSHMDMHVPGIWEEDLKKNRRGMMHAQEHKGSEFKYIISDGEDLEVYTKTYSWSELGYQYEGDTQALVFDSTVKRDRNGFMFEQYAKGYVKNHSVGMVYGEVILAVNDSQDKYWADEYANYQNYIGKAVNPEVAEEAGMFFIIPKAKAIEGSAVPQGSNFATPTQSVVSVKETTEKETQNRNLFTQRRKLFNRKHTTK